MAVVKPSKMSAIQTQVVTEALMLFACERPLRARSGHSINAITLFGTDTRPKTSVERALRDDEQFRLEARAIKWSYFGVLRTSVCQPDDAMEY
jgi:hypothetical protein